MTPKFLTVLTDGDELNVESLLQSDRRHEQQPAIFLSRLASKVSESRASSRVRKIILPVVIWATTILNAIDLSILILVVILIGTVIWMMKPLRQSILAPIGNWMYITTSRKVFAFIDIVKRTFTRHNTQLEEQTFDEDKHHAGPNTYGRPAVKPHNAPEVQVVTLRGKHAADIQWLDVNPKAGTVISCGQDGRIVMWDGIKGEWLARLDRVMQTPCHCGCNGWRLMADVNMELMRNAFIVAKQKKAGLSMHDVALKGMSPSPARCVRSDLGNKWVACGFDDGVVRVWYVETGELVRELYIGTEAVVETKAEATAEVANHFTLRRRRQPVFYSPIRPVADSPKGTGIFQDRVTALAFVGAVIEYCHPLVAEAAAKSVQHGHTAMSKSSQNYLISAHKSGAIHEWDLEAGDCVNTLRSDQVGGIIALYVIEGKAAFRRKGVSWVFSSGKDGTIKCWERNMVSKDGREDIDFTLPLATPEKLPPQWKFVYTLDGHNGSSITSLSADVPVGGMGILITGSQDGAVKVWNFETGDAVCTLSAGGGGLRKKKAEAQMREQINRFNTTDDLHFSILQAHQSHRRDSIDSNATSSTSNEPASNHCGPITQIVVARYCRVETGPGKCRGCDTCFGSGFLVASSSTDETVRVWRLERSDGGAQGNCTLCSADYMHQHYRRRRPTAPVPSTNGGKSHQDSIKRQPSNEELSAELETKTTTLLRRKSPPTPSSSVMRRLPTPLPSTATPSIATASGMLPVEDLEDGMLDIEQLGGDDEITMSPKFLGRVDQPAGRGLVFCKNMMLAGVRRKVSADDVAAKKRDSKWEVWMASLKNYEAVRVVDEDEEDDGASRHMKIPVNTVSLDEDGVNPLEDEFNDGRTDEQGAARNSTKSEESSAIWLLRSLGIITPKPSPLSKSTTLRQLPRHTASKLNAANLAAVKKDIPNGAHHPTARGKDYIEDDEAANLLPFFAVRQIVPLGGDGFACDYGNFVKVVWIGNREADQNDGEERKVKLPSIMSTRAVGQAQSCCGGDGKGKGPEKAGGCCGGKDASTKDGCCGSRGGKKDGCGGDCKCEIPKSRAKKSSASAGCGGAGIE
ncbi:hypothetical protein BC936DRAFT_138330 [Jimgerdemannia flammicorona]|uniref:WD40-repeat-containing domain protein n=1 Tax=Jimgerdemannia flammicorona TaxID=994334 RepID=A0A433CNA5_9FUNG|nr:hypothetical protein BC936DRAFT_138330 [Jimgerdemannia flammicorona]